MAIGAQADGRFDALIHTGVTAKTAHNDLPEPFILPAHVPVRGRQLQARRAGGGDDMLANTFMRAPGEAVGSFALESAIDELARAIGMDPIELRLRNEPDTDPASGRPFSVAPPGRGVPGGGRAVRLGPARDRRPGDAPRRRVAGRHGLRHRDLSLLPHARRRRADHADPGRPRPVEIAAHEMGMGTATAQTQVTAERLGLPLEQVTFAYGESSIPGSCWPADRSRPPRSALR